ncbi:hypothetical protein JW930_05285 [Candidatus Woesearchaeota archaeon]|nr:hypothetical protein [Candidatus Woesearchaeota archaeon]
MGRDPESLGDYLQWLTENVDSNAFKPTTAEHAAQLFRVKGVEVDQLVRSWGVDPKQLPALAGSLGAQAYKIGVELAPDNKHLEMVVSTLGKPEQIRRPDHLLKRLYECLGQPGEFSLYVPEGASLVRVSRVLRIFGFGYFPEADRIHQTALAAVELALGKDMRTEELDKYRIEVTGLAIEYASLAQNVKDARAAQAAGALQRMEAIKYQLQERLNYVLQREEAQRIEEERRRQEEVSRQQQGRVDADGHVYLGFWLGYDPVLTIVDDKLKRLPGYMGAAARIVDDALVIFYRGLRLILDDPLAEKNGVPVNPADDALTGIATGYSQIDRSGLAAPLAELVPVRKVFEGLRTLFNSSRELVSAY